MQQIYIYIYILLFGWVCDFHIFSNLLLQQTNKQKLSHIRLSFKGKLQLTHM